MSDEYSFPEDAREDIVYLARSRNRIEILEALAAGPRTSRDVETATGASRSTLERILTELQERGWAERTHDGTYEATAAGEFAVTEFMPIVRSMKTIRNLGEAVSWLPTDELTIGLHHFDGATVHGPEPNSPTAPATYMTELLSGASEFHCLVCIAPPLAFEQAMCDRVVDGDLTTEHVITRGELDYVREQAERLRRWRAYLAAGAKVYCYDGEIPCNLFVLDKTVLIGASRPATCAFIESENEAVRSWAHGLIKSYGVEANRLDSGTFTENPTGPADQK